MTREPSFVLASASPRRRELLTAAGFHFVVSPVDADERRVPGESPERYVERVAHLKARLGVERHPEAVVVAADTAVVLGDDVLGKPRDHDEARRMLARLSGRAHDVLTGVAVASSGLVLTHVERTLVWFETLSAEAIDQYVESGEPMDKAGAYAIQGLASRFIPRIEGSYSNVVGVPIAALAQLLTRHAAEHALSSPRAARRDR